MVLKLGDLKSWARIAPGLAASFPGKAEPHRLRVEILSPLPIAVFVDRNMQPAQFVGLVHGHETLEFVDVGDIKLVFSHEEDVWIYSIDGEPMAVESDEESYTGPIERRARDHNLEMMQFLMRQNEEARAAQMAQDRIMYERSMRAMGFDPDTGEQIQDENRGGHGPGGVGEQPQTPVSGGTGDSGGPTVAGADAGKDGAAGAGSGGDESVNGATGADKPTVPPKPKL